MFIEKIIEEPIDRENVLNTDELMSDFGMTDFITEVEEGMKSGQYDETEAIIEDIKNGMSMADLCEKHNDWIITDTVIVVYAIELGWNYKEYKSGNIYDGNDPTELQAYNDERMDIVNEAWGYIHDVCEIFEIEES